MGVLEQHSPDDLLTEQEAADALRISMRTLQAWRTRKSGPQFVRLGRLVRYQWKALLALVKDNTQEPK
jgi:hypothetical protein